MWMLLSFTGQIDATENADMLACAQQDPEYLNVLTDCAVFRPVTGHMCTGRHQPSSSRGRRRVDVALKSVRRQTFQQDGTSHGVHG